MRNYGKHLTGRQNKRGVQWTKEQQEVIRLRDRNILVSAAAGSGKTAVLVERILSKITDKEHPVDIDRLLIMTFTRAAAGEMKERISASLPWKALWRHSSSSATSPPRAALSADWYACASRPVAVRTTSRAVI